METVARQSDNHEIRTKLTALLEDLDHQRQAISKRLGALDRADDERENDRREVALLLDVILRRAHINCWNRIVVGISTLQADLRLETSHDDGIPF